ncbi:MAG: hypothetical protein D6785_08100 [Planctomycetota bacterium]|nr:MAG: hypothetical protein D6785_08100 [Planctomycetota bacterium]
MKPKKIISFSLILILFFFTFPLKGEEWAIYGTRARGMGGAQVAIAKGTDSAYWNPAGFAFGNRGTKKNPILPVELQLIHIGAEAAVTGNFLKDIGDLQTTVDSFNGGLTGLQSRLNALNITQSDISTMMKLLEIMGRFGKDSSKGALVTLEASALDLQVGNFALTSQVTVYGGVNPIIDFYSNNMFNTLQQFGATATDIFGVNFNPATANPQTPAGQQLAQTLDTLGGAALSLDQAEALVYFAEQAGVNVADPQFQQILESAVANTAAKNTGTLDQNQTGVFIKGVLLAEVRGSFAMQLVPNVLAVGGNLKLIQGITFNRFIFAKDAQNMDKILQEIYNDLDRQRKRTWQFSIDLGVMAKLGMIQVGLTGRNLIPTQYDTKVGKDLRIQPQARAGVALNLDWIVVALDIDLNPNGSDTFSKFDSQMISAGVEVIPLDLGIFSLALRAGIYRNLAEPREKEVYTLGFGISLWMLTIEGSASVDAKAIKSGNFNFDYKNKSISDIPDRLGFSLSASLGFSF